MPGRTLGYIDTALQGVTREGTMAWRMGGFPLDDVTIRSKTGSAEVYGKQSTSWVASYTKDYVVVMMVSQGGTGSGTSGPAVRKIWETLYGVKGEDVDPTGPRSPAPSPRPALPTFLKDGSILPPAAEGRAMSGRTTVARPRPAACARPGLDWVLMAAVLGAAGARHACSSGRPPRPATT